MSQTQSTEEILHRMRVHVSQHGGGRQWPSVVPTSGEDSDGFSAHSSELSLLGFEIDTALEGTRQVGQINPRNPGILNDAIQFMKKVMRRSLSWYTRPIHHFQGAVIRALQQALVLLRGHEVALQTAAGELARQAALIEHGSQESSKHTAALAGEVAALRQKISSHESSMSALAEKEARFEAEALALDQRLSEAAVELDRRLLQVTVESRERLQETKDDLEARLSRMDVAHAESLDRALTPYSQRLAGVSDELGWLRSELGRLEDELGEAKLQNRVRDRDLRRYFHDMQGGTVAPSGQPNPVPTPPMFPSGIKSESEFDYFLFEERYRGDESLIASRQKEYLEYFRGRQNVADIGCGRGEFLELMRENGITAKGVELGTDQYLLCREKALDVVQQDLFTYLESVPDESLGGLFSAQVIEHLTASDQLRFVSLAHRKTQPGSPVIFETINAQCVFAVVRNFFVDPTHIRPVHPETLKFAMESAQFHDVELRFSSPMSERRIPALSFNGDTPQLAEFNRAIEGVNELLYGFMDYAAIGWR
jgi:SAM-dependent methyltransferase